MAIIINKTAFLDAPISVESLHGVVFSNENKGHKFVITGIRGGELQTFTGSVIARFIRANNTTILMGEGAEGELAACAEIENGKVAVSLARDCYNVPGRFQLTVFVTNEGETSCVYAAVGTVQRSENGTLIDDGVALPSVDELQSMLNEIQQYETNIATAGAAQIAAVQAKGEETLDSIPDDYTALQGEVDDLKSAFTDYEAGFLPKLIVENSYITVDGEINPYNGWSRTDYIPVRKYSSFVAQTSVASGYNVFYDANFSKIGSNFHIGTTAKEITIPSNAYYVIFSNTASGMANLIVEFKTLTDDSVEQLQTGMKAVNDALTGYNVLNYSLPSGSNIGNNWNNIYYVDIPEGTTLEIRFCGYSGNNFTRLAIWGTTASAQDDLLYTFTDNIASSFTVKTSNAYVSLYLGLVRSEAESPVSYSLQIKGDYGTMLGNDIMSLKKSVSGNTAGINTVDSVLSDIATPHINLYDYVQYTDGYVYTASGGQTAIDGCSIASAIQIKANQPYYIKNTRCYFSWFMYEDGTHQKLADSDSVRSGIFTPTKDGYANLTINTDNKQNCLITTDSSLYYSEKTNTYYSPNKLELDVEAPHVFRVGPNREYASLLEGLIVAEQYKNSIVYVDPGMYDMTQEFKDKYGNDYFSSTATDFTTKSNFRGCPLINGVHVIGYGGVTVTGGLLSTDNPDAISWWSIFNGGDDAHGDNGYGFTIENITIKSVSQHIRYLVHDEYGGTDYDYINKYINIHFVVFPGYVKRCIGGGLGKHAYILIDNCTIDAPAYDETIRGINYHNDAGAGALNEIYIKNCYIPNGTVGITWYGQTPATEKSIMYVNNCYLQAEPVKQAETASAPYENVNIVSWRNTIAQ